jgi:hypothetical protein
MLDEHFVINSGSGSGTSRLRQYVPLLFEKESSKAVWPESLNQKYALKWTRSVCLRAF